MQPRKVPATRITACQGRCIDSWTKAAIHSPTMLPTDAFAPQMPIILPRIDEGNQFVMIATVVVRTQPWAGPSRAQRRR